MFWRITDLLKKVENGLFGVKFESNFCRTILTLLILSKFSLGFVIIFFRLKSTQIEKKDLLINFWKGIQ